MSIPARFKSKPHTGLSTTAVRLMMRAHFMMHVYYSMTFFEVEEDCIEVDTLATNSVTVWINPRFWNQLNKEQKLTAVAHEMMHRMLLHSTRRGERDPYIYNIAGDHVINLMLKAAGFVPLEGLTIDGKPWNWFCDSKYDGWTTERVYDDILKEYDKPQPQPQPQPGEGGEGKAGDGQGAPQRGNQQAKKDLGAAADLVDYATTPEGGKDEATVQSVEELEGQIRKEMKEMEQAAKMAGNCPQWIKRTMENADHVKVPWDEVLEEYIKGLHSADYSWHKWDRLHYVMTGALSPDMYEPALGRVLLYVDCSGSCWSALPKFNKHITDIWTQVVPKGVDIRYFQTRVAHRYDQAFERGEGDVVIHQLGGGGTDFRWLADEIENEPEQYDLVLVLTDMYGNGFGREPEGVPLIWLSVSSVDTAPWGEVLSIN